MARRARRSTLAGLGLVVLVAGASAACSSSGADSSSPASASATTKAASATPAIVVAKGGRANTDYCTTAATCRWIDVSMSGFAPSTSYTVSYSTDCANPTTKKACTTSGANAGSEHYATTTVTTDAGGAFVSDPAGATTRAFGFANDSVWVDVESGGTVVTSNKVRW